MRRNKRLIILDLDGLLFIRKSTFSKYNHRGTSNNTTDGTTKSSIGNSTKDQVNDPNIKIKNEYDTFEHKKYLYVLRPGYDNFIDYCLSNYDVGVFSSITEQNITYIIDNVFGNKKHKLKFILDRN